MNERKFLACLDEKTALCASQIRALEADDRRDEAVFAKIRMNVYDIFRTIFNASANSPDPEAFFLEKLDQIPRNWRTSLDLARQHSNDAKAHIEQLKLDTADEIRRTFHQLREGRA